MNLIDFAASEGWAMEPSRVDELVNVVFDHADGIVKAPEVLEAYRSKGLERSERARERDGVALLYVDGPLFKKANLMVEFSGATSYQILMRDLQVALDNPDIHTIVQVIDSPGGQANGCDELAAAIHAASKIKPVISYVSGMAASGGYWLAAAGSRIVISEGALLGSIGVVLGIPDRTAADERRGVRTFEFVSSQSPGKRPDPTQEAGKTQIQAMVDDLAEVFISAVAKYRGVSVDDVVTKFGAGGMKIGAKAVAAGMADEVGQLEATISSLITSGRQGRFQMNRSPGGFSMSDKTPDQIAAEARSGAQARMKSIMSCDAAQALPTLANHLAYDTEIAAADATKILASAQADMPKPEEPKTPEASGDQGKTTPPPAGGDFGAHKKDAGTLGASDRVGGDANAEAAKSGWSKAFANHGQH